MKNLQRLNIRLLIDTTRVLLDTYPMMSENKIVGHSDIAPERKTDPGPYFDWQRYRDGLIG